MSIVISMLVWASQKSVPHFINIIISYSYSLAFNRETDLRVQANAMRFANDSGEDEDEDARAVRSTFINMQNQLRAGPTAATSFPSPQHRLESGSPQRWPPRSKRSFNSAAFLHSLGNHRVPCLSPGPFSRSAAKVVPGSTCVPAGTGSSGPPSGERCPRRNATRIISR